VRPARSRRPTPGTGRLRHSLRLRSQGSDLPLLGRTGRALDTYLREARPRLQKDHEPALWLTRHGTRLPVTHISALVRMHARRAEIPQPLSLH
jgi:site-specific recombinase XerD